MRHSAPGRLVTFAVLAILAASCRPAPAPQPTSVPQTPTERPTATPPPATPTLAPTPTHTPEPTATLRPHARVSENTNCRSGPDAAYAVLGALQVGQVAEVMGRSEAPGYWYVRGADLPEGGCWLWGEYAQLEGDVDPLPVFTPAPSPTPAIGFRLYFEGYARCESTLYVVFAVQNVGGTRFWSGYIQVEEFATHQILHRRTERHPFAAWARPVCPPDHGNELWPGETRYIHATLDEDDFESGQVAIGTITLCTADFQGDSCRTQYSYFELP